MAKIKLRVKKKQPENSGKPITQVDVNKLSALAMHNTPTGLIAYKMGRTKRSIYKIASDNSISLHPTNKSPYNRKK